jgi:hypothetical protein
MKDDILCSYFSNGMDEQHGDQPIRVFFNIIKTDFIGIQESLSSFQNNNVEKVKLDYLTENIKVIGPSTDGHKITLHDTFLSFLWAYIYSILVTTPMGGKEISDEENLEARELRKYAISLMTDFTVWDKDKTPNPEKVGKDEKKLVGVANAVFLNSVRFILLHEFAHVFLGHTSAPIALKTPENLNKMEIDADKVAIEWAIQTFAKDDDDFTGKLSLIAALNSLSFSPNKFSDLITHPAPEDRIRTCLERLKIEKDDFIWGYAFWSIMEWQTNFGVFFLPTTYKVEESFQDRFYEIIKELKEFKLTGINKFT